MRNKLIYLLQIVLISIIFAFSFASIKFSIAEASIDAEELIIDGWILDSISEGSYDDFVSFWNDLGVLPSDYLLSEVSPSDVKLLFYQHVISDAIVYVEIHAYDSVEAAELEYSAQKASSRPPIFGRFVYGERIFQEGPYLLFVFSNEEAEQTLIPYDKYGQIDITLVDDFFTKLFQRLVPTLYGVDEGTPSSSFEGRVIWGIQPGDRFTWDTSYETFTGSLGTGMSHSSGSSSATWEILDISEDVHAVLVGEIRNNFKIFNQYFSSIILDAEYSVNTWYTIDDGPLVLATSSVSQAAIFPLYLEGRTIIDFVEEEIEHLPEKNYIDGAHSMSGHGRTSSGSGYTPLKTEWRDITIHKGTGILLSYDFYYNDNEFSITTSRSVGLMETNFDLDGRFVNIQILELDVAFSSDVVERGEPLSIQAEVRDINENYVEGAIVTVLVGGISVELSDVGNGRYEGMAQTGDLSVGEHGLTVRAEKEGYESGTTTQSVNVETPSLYVTVKLPSDTLRKGREFTLTAEVRDISNNPVDGATVSSTFDGQEMVLTEIGGGEHQIKINTKEYDEGFYTIDVLAVRDGYLDGVAQESITLEKSAGIPGFPSISIIVGLIIGITTLRACKRTMI
jgi:hypothetical protein